MDPREKAVLGSSGLEVTRLGLGCAAIGGLYGDIPDEQAVQVVHRAFALGLNLLDTAPLYGAGKSETRLGLALKDIPRDNYILASKVGRVLEPVVGEDNDEGIFDNPPPFKPVFDFSYDGVMRSFDESLQRLGVDRIDILHIHDPDAHWQEAISGAYPALERLRGEGVISAVISAREKGCKVHRAARRHILFSPHGLRNPSPDYHFALFCERVVPPTTRSQTRAMVRHGPALRLPFLPARAPQSIS